MLPFLVISGPSAVGKGSLILKLRARFPNAFEYAISYTSRAPRVGERNGREYFFVSRSEFEESINQNKFIEFTKSYDHYYGTPLHEVERIAKIGKICLLEIDVKGVKQIQHVSSGLKCFYIFIRPPNLHSLKLRLHKRSTESETQIRLRLEGARQELEEAKLMHFDRVLINDQLEKCYNELEQAIFHLYSPLAPLLFKLSS